MLLQQKISDRKLLQVLSTLSTLETLDLEDNLLGATEQAQGGGAGGGAFPPGIAGLSRLQWLNIARCELQQVPHLVERLSALRILDLTNNRSEQAFWGKPVHPQ